MTYWFTHFCTTNKSGESPNRDAKNQSISFVMKSIWTILGWADSYNKTALYPHPHPALHRRYFYLRYSELFLCCYWIEADKISKTESKWTIQGLSNFETISGPCLDHVWSTFGPCLTYDYFLTMFNLAQNADYLRLCNFWNWIIRVQMTYPWTF